MEMKSWEECTPAQQEFIGTTFPTPKGGVLTVVGCCVEKLGSNALFKVVCSICSADVELFPDGFKGVKDYIVKGGVPCGCTKIKWSEAQYKVLVKRECAKRNYEFLGWSEEFVGHKTKLHLHNLDNGNTWNTTSVHNFLNIGSGCPVAGATAAGISNGNSLRKPYDTVIKQLTEICNTDGHTFITLPEYKNSKSKFKWVCSNGHNCESSVDTFLRGSRCKTCRDLNTGMNGFYKDRIHEQDYLYIYKIKGQPYIKVGRTFRPDERLKENQKRINKYYGNRKHKITQTHLSTGTHEEIYNLEQAILSKEFVVHSVDLDDGYGSSELLHESCYGAVVAFVGQWEIDRGE